MKNLVHVAVGVIEDAQGRILIARRPDHLHQGGLWEFPGGKIAEGEDVITALRRELYEEVGIDVNLTCPLIMIEYDYGDKQVLLDVHRVTAFRGEAHGKEGQPVKWVTIAELADYLFPAANRGIINAVRLPTRYMITDEYNSPQEYIEKVQLAVEQGVRLIQLRAKQLQENDYLVLSKQLLTVQTREVSIMLNTRLEIFTQTDAAGLHLDSQRLMQTQTRPVNAEKLLSASVHNEIELAHANKIGVDFLVISPVMPTLSHPDAIPLGWDGFAKLASKANCSVYALGGMVTSDIAKAVEMGGHGIAGITVFNSRA